MGDENEEQSLHGEELLTPVVSAVSAAASEALFAGPCFRITAGLDGLTLPTGDRTHSTPATVGGRATLSSGEAAGAVTIFYDDGAAVELAGGDGGGGGGAGGNAESSSLAALAAACEPAPFGRGQENVLDPSFRRAVKLEPGRFATTFDVAATGILFDIQRLLVPAAAELRAELYKMHVYGPGDFFKAHVDTPRGEGHVASLVVCLPTRHAGGALTVRGPDGSEVEFDFSADSQHVSWAAFYPDCLHEVAEVREGRRVTLTYNVYATTVEADAAAAARAASAAGEPAGEEAEAAGAGGSSSQSPLRIALEELARFGVVLPSRIQQRRQQQQPVPALASLCGGRGTGVYATLRSLVNNGAFLPLGGRVVFAAQHAYPVTVRQPARSFCPALLKGPDMLLAAAALALGLEVEVKLMVRKAEEWDSESGPDYHHHEAEVVALEDSDRYRGLPFYGEQQDDDDDTQETAWLQRQGVVEPPAQRDAPGTTVLVASEAAGSGGGGFADTGRAADARGHTQVAIATTAWGNESYVEVQYCCAAIVVRFPPPQERSGGSEAAAGAPPPLGVHNY